MIIIQVTSKVFIGFFLKIDTNFFNNVLIISLDTITFSVSTSFRKMGVKCKIYFFHFQNCQTLKCFYLFLYVIINFYVL